MSRTLLSTSADLALIADAHRAVRDDHDAAEEVFQGLLCGKGDGDAADAESREHGGEIDAVHIEQDKGSDEDCADLGEAADEAGESDPVSGLPALEPRHVESREAAESTRENPGNAEDDNDHPDSARRRAGEHQR